MADPIWISLETIRPWRCYNASLPSHVPDDPAERDSGSGFEPDVAYFQHEKTGAVLDVGWYNFLQEPDGAFWCREVVGKDWDNPTNELKTRDPVEVFRWLMARLAANV